MLVESSCCKINKLCSEIFEWDLNSHKRGCLCTVNPREKGYVDSELACGCVSKLLLEVAIDLGLNLIVKISIIFLVDLFTLRIARSNPPQVFYLENVHFIGFPG